MTGRLIIPADQPMHVGVQEGGLGDPGVWHRFEASVLEVMIGRSPTCDLVLGRACISRRHCKLVRRGELVTVVDVGSTGGVIVGRRRVTEHILDIDDAIDLTDFRVIVAASPTPPMPRDAASPSPTTDRDHAARPFTLGDGATLQIRVVAKGEGETIHAFASPTVTIGRALSNDLVLASDSVSKRQCVVLRQQGSLFILDAHSNGGTYLNGRAISASIPVRLGHDDQVSFGDIDLTFTVG